MTATTKTVPATMPTHAATVWRRFAGRSVTAVGVWTTGGVDVGTGVVSVVYSGFSLMLAMIPADSKAPAKWRI